VPESRSGYVTDVDYVFNFLPELAPAWLDHVAVISCVRPPSHQDGFAWCDLGCGLGGTAVLLAATHPRGRFVGIDMMPTHIDHARRLATEGAIGNVQFFNVDFGAAEPAPAKFDYIVAHGVYSWVDARTQEQLRTFIQRHLKPGGLVYVSYNAMPGRGPDISFQYLLRAIAETVPGSSVTRVSTAISMVRDLAKLQPPSLDRSFAHVDPKEQSEQLPIAYVAHEFLIKNWKPLFVADVRASMAEIGLTPVGSATLIQNYDSFVLPKAARDALAGIGDGDLREVTRDFLLNQSFRRDVFVLNGHRLDGEEQRQRLLNSTFCLSRPPSAVDYEVSTTAGQLRFDNPFTRRIVARLAGGPRRLGDIAIRDEEIGNLIANALVLCAARMVRPVEGADAPVKKLNETILRRLGGAEELRHLALPCGTALRLDPNLMRALGDKFGIDESLTAWRDFLRLHGID